MNLFARLLPVIVFVLLAGMLLAGLLLPGERSDVPSPLVGGEVPAFSLEGLKRGGGFSDADLREGVALVNVWASWCLPCRAEHPILEKLSCVGGLELYGLNFKDTRENAEAFLRELGNPFTRVGFDENGFTGLDWGVYGVPETFVTGNDRVVYKHVGPLSRETVTGELAPLFRSLDLDTACLGEDVG